jgi:hypothetical protein
LYTYVLKNKKIKIYGKKSRKKSAAKKTVERKKQKKLKKKKPIRIVEKKKRKTACRAAVRAPLSARDTRPVARGRGHATVHPLAISPDGVQQPSSLCHDPNRPRPFAALISQPSNARASVDLTAG